MNGILADSSSYDQEIFTFKLKGGSMNSLFSGCVLDSSFVKICYTKFLKKTCDWEKIQRLEMKLSESSFSAMFGMGYVTSFNSKFSFKVHNKSPFLS